MHTESRASRLVLTLVCVVAVGSFSTSTPSLGAVWTVGGTGADFTEIQPAIDAAVSGDLILVRSGTYGPFLIDGKGVSIVADENATVETGTARVQEISAPDDVILADLEIEAPPGDADSARAAVDLRQSQGSIRLQRLTIRGVGGDPSCSTCTRTTAMVVEDCDDVALLSCTLTATKGPSEETIGLVVPGGTALHARASSVALYDCVLQGGEGADGAAFPTPGPGSDGGHAVDSDFFVFAANSLLVGGNGGPGGDGGPGPGGIGGAGGDGLLLSVDSSGTPEAQLFDNSIQGGTGGAGGPGTPPGLAGANGQPIQAPEGTVNQFSGTARVMTAATIANSCIKLSVTFQGVPGDGAVLLVSGGAGFNLIRSEKGVRLVGVFDQTVEMGTLPASGILQADLFIPSIGPAEHETWHIQACMVQETSLTLGSSSTVVIVKSEDDATCAPPAFCAQQTFNEDFGDAPEGVAAYAATAPAVAGAFPTCIAPGPTGTREIDAVCVPISNPPGPAGSVRHVQVFPESFYWLGCHGETVPSIDSETDAKFNSAPLGVSACDNGLGTDCTEAPEGGYDQDECYLDGVDTGLLTSKVVLRPCAPTTFSYEVFNCTGVQINAVLNVLVDLNKDGDWNDAFGCPVDACSHEWAVKNHTISLEPGCNTLETPLIFGAPFEHDDVWMRITISDVVPATADDFPWAGTGGSQLHGGETEDYLVDIRDPTAVVAGEEPALPGGMRLRTLGVPGGPTGLLLSLSGAARVELVVVNVAGQRVATIWSGVQTEATRRYVWDGLTDGGVRAASGFYVARAMVTTDGATQILTSKLLVLE